MYVHYNPNPLGKHIGDCTVRAICRVTGKDWNDIFLGLSAKAFELKDLPDANAVWERYLKLLGFKRHIIPDTCPDCYTVREFASDHKYGSYILATGTHVVAVVDGNYYDDWDSGDKVPLYFYTKE